MPTYQEWDIPDIAGALALAESGNMQMIGRVCDALLAEGAIQIIRPPGEGGRGCLQSDHGPVGLEMRNVVADQAGKRDHTQTLAR
jgi:hypothetical protein